MNVYNFTIISQFFVVLCFFFSFLKLRYDNLMLIQYKNPQMRYASADSSFFFMMFATASQVSSLGLA